MPPFRFPRRSRVRIQAEVDEELAFELDMRARELEAQGVSSAEARRRAMAEFGDLEATRRYCMDADWAAQAADRRADWRDELRQDARLALRGLRQAPGFTLVVLLTLALGIGANTAVFSVVRRVLLDRLPYHAPERLVRLYGGPAGVSDPRGMLTPAEIEGLRQSHALAAVAPFGFASGYTYTSDRPAEIWQGMGVGPGFFRVLSVRALLGRTLDARDVEPGAPPTILLGHALWQRTFGGDSGVVGRVVQLDGRGVTVVGVMPPDFVSPTFVADAWTPLDLDRFLRDPVGAQRNRMFRAVARMADGTTRTALRAELATLAQQTAQQYPELRDAAPVNSVPLRDAMVGDVRPALLVVMSAAALVLVIACVNVSGLLLARAKAKRHELAVRVALGAGRGRLARQLLTESALLGLGGGAASIGLAYWGRHLLITTAGRALPTMDEARLDAGMLAFAVIVSLACGLAFGLVPALAGTRADPQGALKEGSRGASGGRGSQRAGRLLVAAQAALAVVLLIGSGLLGRTLMALERTGVGYDTAAAQLTFRVNLSQVRYADAGSRAAFFDALAARLAALPGVRAVGAANIAPWNGPNSVPFAVDGRPEPASGPEGAGYAAVYEGWFAALGIPIRAGRTFTDRDRAGAPPVVLVSEALARRHWPGTSPIGQRVRVGDPNAAWEDAPWREVVGVVADVRGEATADPLPLVYLPARQAPLGGADVVVRVAGDALALVPAARRELHALDSALPLINPRTLETVFDDLLAGQRLPMLFTTAFAVLALVLATLGVYGLMAYTVTARMREFGIRAALGAGRGRVLVLVLRQGLATALAGTVVGLFAAAAASRLVAGLLVGVAPLDPLTFTVTPLALLAAATLACLVPGLRAVRVEPVEVLRE